MSSTIYLKNGQTISGVDLTVTDWAEADHREGDIIEVSWDDGNFGQGRIALRAPRSSLCRRGHGRRSRTTQRPKGPQMSEPIPTVNPTGTLAVARAMRSWLSDRSHWTNHVP